MGNHRIHTTYLKLETLRLGGRRSIRVMLLHEGEIGLLDLLGGRILGDV